MSFVHPGRLCLLGIGFVFAFLWIGTRLRRQRERRSLGLHRRISPSPEILLLLVLLGLVFALAQPRTGKPAPNRLPAGRDLILVLDASRSMAAEDAVPNRMMVASESACSIIDALGTEAGSRVGVIAFAGVPVLRCGLTLNLGAARTVVRSIAAGSVRPGGTDLAAAVDLAINSFDDRERTDGRSIVVLTDGEDLSGRLTASLARWRESKVTVHAVAIGDAEVGHPIPTSNDRSLLYEGKTVLSKRQDAALRELTEATGGVFVPLGLNRADLGKIYRETLAPHERRDRVGRQGDSVVGKELYAVPALMSLVCWLGYQSRHLGLRRAGVVGIVLLLGASLGAQRAESLEEAMRRGRQLYEQGSFKLAINEFRAVAQRYPDEALPLYNLAASQFQNRQYQEAELSYKSALALAGPDLQSKIDYAVANCLVMRYELAEAIRWYDRGLSRVPRSVEGEQLAVDIRLNRDYVLKLLESSDPAGTETPEGRQDPSRPPEPAKNKAQSAPAVPEPSQTNQRGQGGAGGDGQESRQGKSPAEELAEAVESIRRVKESRLSEPDPPIDAPSTERDW